MRGELQRYSDGDEQEGRGQSGTILTNSTHTQRPLPNYMLREYSAVDKASLNHLYTPCHVAGCLGLEQPNRHSNTCHSIKLHTLRIDPV